MEGIYAVESVAQRVLLLVLGLGDRDGDQAVRVARTRLAVCFVCRRVEVDRGRIEVASKL